MTPGFSALLAIAVGLGSWVGVAMLRRYAMRHLLDVPNERSSHSEATPRGGGLAITLAHLVGVIAAGISGLTSPELVVVLAGGGLAVASIGLLDDHGHVEAPLRLLCHVLAFGWALFWLGGLPPINFGWGPVNLGWGGTVLLLVYLSWFLNLFNFMDGIDGLAGMQALVMCVTAASLLHVVGVGPVAALPIVLLATATAGFLMWNWPPARIFMGDAGSGYLGYALGALAVWTVAENWLTPWVWLILGGAFLADATVTLLVRAGTKAPLVQAHRSHAYQRLTRHWRGHRPVTLAFTAVNVFWLAPWAVVATRWPHYGAASAAAALVPLFFVAVQLGSGRPGDIQDLRTRKVS